jgi:hypothetical protein
VYDGGPGAQPGSFIVSARIAIVLSQRPELLREAAAAALSIRCAAMVNLPSTGRGGAAGGESRGASTYNRQLGTEYYHDARTGENYLVDVTKGETDGPQGRGYYSCNGNWCTKLEAGRSDP